MVTEGEPKWFGAGSTEKFIAYLILTFVYPVSNFNKIYWGRNNLFVVVLKGK